MRAPSSEEDAFSASIWSTLERVLKGKFRGGFTGATEREDESDYREAAAEAYACVKRRIDNPDAEPVENLEAFSATVAHNVFYKLLKKKRPRWHRLAVDIRSTLKLDERLALWERDQSEISGKRAWKGQPVRIEPRGKLVLELPDEAKRQCFSNRDPSSLLLCDLPLAFFGWVGSPFGYDPLVRFCFRALDLQDLQTQPLGPGAAGERDPSPSPADASAGKAMGEFVWAQIAELDPVRRGIFLLFESPGDGPEAVGDLLVNHEICTLQDLADAAGLTFDQLAEFRQKGRATYELIGALYSLPPKQVENIRRGVSQRLWRRLRDHGYLEGRKS